MTDEDRSRPERSEGASFRTRERATGRTLLELRLHEQTEWKKAGRVCTNA